MVSLSVGCTNALAANPWPLPTTTGALCDVSTSTTKATYTTASFVRASNSPVTMVSPLSYLPVPIWYWLVTMGVDVFGVFWVQVEETSVS